MRGCLKGCLGTVGSVVVVAAIAYAGWRWGDPFFPEVDRWLGEGTSVGTVGDANGDGAVEVVIGVPGWEAPSSITILNAGQARVVSPALGEATLDRFDGFRAGVGG